MKFSRIEKLLLAASALILVPTAISLLGGGPYMLAAWKNIAGAGPSLFAVAWIVALLGVYFLPTAVAYGAKHHNAVPIFIVNLLLGWTLIGWVVCLAWAFTRPPAPTQTAK